jgi:hypothetical protein
MMELGLLAKDQSAKAWDLAAADKLAVKAEDNAAEMAGVRARGCEVRGAVLEMLIHNKQGNQ